MKWPGLKLGSRNLTNRVRSAHEVAEDNAIQSSPVPSMKDVQKAIAKAMKAMVELECSVIRMLSGKTKEK